MAVVVVMSFVVRHKLTKRTINDLLRLLNIFLGGTVALTRGYVDRFLQRVKYGYEKKLYCSNCLAAVDEGMTFCSVTGCHKDLTKDGAVSYFITVPLLAQISALLTRADIYGDIFSPKCNDPSIISDVTSGRLYKKMLSQTNGQKVISFCWNTDGVSIFKSSNYNIWPFYITVNELSEHLRFQDPNMLLAGLWFGPKKPLMQTYLQPIFDNLAKLEKGVRIKTINGDEKIHGYLLFGTYLLELCL